MNLILKQVRLLQWTKNLLIFVPMIFSHEISPELLTAALPGFFAWCFLASFVYVVNDIIDRDQDRLHPEKSKRPIASGKLSRRSSIILAIVCLTITVIFSMYSGTFIQRILLIYFCFNLAYTFKAKKIPWFDLLFLAQFYLLRVISGFQFTHSPMSSWFLLACFSLFLGLSAAKRENDLQGSLLGRGYGLEDKARLILVTKISWIFLGLVLCLYPLSYNAKHLYQRPWIIPVSSLSLIPLFVIIRRKHQELIDELLKSPILYALLALVALVFYLSL